MRYFNSSPAIEVPLIQIMAVPHSVPFPSGGTWFDTLHKTFDDVHVQTNNDNGIPTGEFLEAAESLTTLFGELITLLKCPRSCTRVSSLRLGRCARFNGIHAGQERHGWQYQGLSAPPPHPSEIQRETSPNDRLTGWITRKSATAS